MKKHRYPKKQKQSKNAEKSVNQGKQRNTIKEQTNDVITSKSENFTSTPNTNYTFSHQLNELNYISPQPGTTILSFPQN